MTREQFFEITYLTKLCSKEISGMGTLIINKEGNFEVEKLFLLEQEVSAAATDLGAQAVSKCMYEARECKGSLSFWWHSHVNMHAFFSVTDVATIKDHAKHGMFVGLVINKKGEYKIAMGLQSPKLYIDQGLELEIVDSISNELILRLDSEYATKVKEKTYKAEPYMGRDFTDSYYRKREIPEPKPMIWSQEKGRYVDNPDYHDFRRVKKNKNKKQTHAQEINAVINMEEKEITEFNKLSASDQNEWFKKYIDFFGVNPVDTEELAMFYINHNKLTGSL